MSEFDFSELSELGKKIEKSVKQMSESKEAEELKKNIKCSVDKILSEVGKNVSESVSNAANSVNKGLTKAAVSLEKTTVKYEKNVRREKRVKKVEERYLPVLKKAGRMGSAGFKIAFGCMGMFIFGTTFIFSLLTYAMEGLQSGDILVPFFVSIVFSSLSLSMIMSGSRRLGFAKRFRIYAAYVQERHSFRISDVAERISRSERFVIKDLKRMIHNSWFLEGHFSEDKKLFIASNEEYEQYLTAMREQDDLRREEEQKRIRESVEREIIHNPTPKEEPQSEADRAVEEGKKYIRLIREANDKIPGVEISNKLDRMESIAAKIFEYIDKHPEKLPDISRFLNYYMPTTLKLLNAYHEFDSQPVQGENIRKGKQEIEMTMDNINLAFEKLLDQLFQDSMLDVSTDISVLSTMLAGEGLLQDDFTKQ